MSSTSTPSSASASASAETARGAAPRWARWTVRAPASTAGSAPATRPTWPRDVVEPLEVGDHREQLVAAHLALERPGVAAGDHAAVVDDHDVVRQAVGLLQVLGGQQDRRAPVHQRLEHVPQLDAGARVEARGGLVEEQHLGPGDERRGQVEAAAHAARVRLHQPVGRRRPGRTAPAARRRGRARRGGPRWCSSPIIWRFSRPVSSASTVASCAARPMQLAHVARRRQHVEAGHARRARVGDGQGGEDADGGGLPGAVRPEQAADGARGDLERDAVERRLRRRSA